MKKTDIEEAKKLIDTIPPIDGEIRSIEKCDECGKLFGRRYIPFGTGYGLTVKPCMCQLTHHAYSTTIISQEP